jgi:hypothetical protein
VRSTSPTRAAGIRLPDDLCVLDGQVVALNSGAQDVGCYPYGSDPLAVKVDGRASYPTGQTRN